MKLWTNRLATRVGWSRAELLAHSTTELLQLIDDITPTPPAKG